MKSVKYYQDLIQAAKNRARDYWRMCREIESDYTKEKRLNILFSNTETIRTAIATNNPKPVIRTRFPKQQTADKAEKNLARTVGEVAERTVIYNNDCFDFNGITEDIVRDAVLFGRGIPRVYYEAEIKNAQDNYVGDTPETDDAEAQAAISPSEKESLQEKGHEQVSVKRVRYDCFLHQDVREWEDVGWVAFKHLMDRPTATKEFGPKAKTLQFSDEQTKNNSGEKYNKNLYASVWEIWDKNEEVVVFISENSKEFLRASGAPYDIAGFFPVPGLLQFIKGKDLTPTPEYTVYKKTAEALEKICTRIDSAVANIKSTGIIAGKDSEAFKRVLNARDNSLVAIDVNIGQLSAQGGLRAMLAEYPNDEKLKVLATLDAEKTQRLGEIYEITGISDLLRGQSDAGDTATAQQIKGKFGSLRLQARQSAAQELIKLCFRMITEIICGHYSVENLQAASSIILPTAEQKQAAFTQFAISQQQAAAAARQGVPAQSAPPPDILTIPTWDDVLNVLNSDRLRSYTIEVESTATAFDADQDEKGRRMEFFSAASGMITNNIPFLQANPEFISAFKQTILFTIGGFANSRILKEAFEESFNEWEARIKMPMPAQPTPDMIVAQAQQTAAKAQLQMAGVKQAEVNLELQKLRTQTGQEQQKININAQKTAGELQIKGGRLQTEQAKAAADVRLRQQGLK